MSCLRGERHVVFLADGVHHASDLPHGGRRRRRGGVVDASHGDLQQAHHPLLAGDGVAAGAGGGEHRAVEHLGCPLLPDDGRHPPRQLGAVRCRGLPREQLQQQHAVRAHVGAKRRRWRRRRRRRRGDAVLADAGLHGGREEDVGGLEVAVSDGAAGLVLLVGG
ncbi:Os09g0376650 [Oryza sativa Japonica Group]|uniref:Os09g0376650 protein n=1 Tax=Oryza sativa subsp. japonica TaxID=39947 RepID=A0A0P0XLZ3_ORYSJ|nr:hypothetical protein EE612_047445 [Oryza sativa]BAT07811.1 Os09g0376650 [Oryza sativa Japonica Group]